MERISLSREHIKLRIVIAIISAIIGIGLLVYTVFSHFKVRPGWEIITANSAVGLNCSDDFVFQYRLGAGDISATEEKRAVTAVYSGLVAKAYQLFDNNSEFEDVHNVYYINHHVGETIEVDAALYKAFEKVHVLKNRTIYLGPIYEQYGSLFFCVDDTEAVNFDPFRNEDLAEWFGEIADFAKDQDSVDVQLLGDNRIRLYVSDSYLSYAKNNGVDSFIDFDWMKNAFIIDYLAEELIERGYTGGSISSYDGFIRNLDNSGEEYAFHLYDRWDGEVFDAATMKYIGDRSIVWLRDYKMNNSDSTHYYETKDGEIRLPYVDISDGLSRSALHNFIAYSEDMGCSDLLMRMIPVYVVDRFDKNSLSDFEQGGVSVIFFENGVLYYTDADLVLSDLCETENKIYAPYLLQ